MPSQQEAFVIGLSGPSSSGKTTLARLLRDIWPRTFILHEDDFYWPDSQIPVKNGVQDWDCFEAIDLSTLQDTLEYIRAQGDPPESFVSKEDQNSIGDCPVDQQVIRRWRERAESLQRYHHRRIAVIDGFLLYAEAMDRIWKQLDVKLFLRTDLTTAKTRREFRSGYVTLEGFWQDPPGEFLRFVERLSESSASQLSSITWTRSYLYKMLIR